MTGRGRWVAGWMLPVLAMVVAAAAVTVAAVPPAVAAAPDRREVEGRALFVKGEFQKALDIYAELFAESGDPLFLRNIGRCHQKLQQPDKAISSFREYLRRGRKLKPAEREEIAGFIREMEELKAKRDASAAARPEPAVDSGTAGAVAVAGKSTPDTAPPPRSADKAAPAGDGASGRKVASVDRGAAAGSSTAPGADLSRPARGTAPGSHADADRSRPLTQQWWFWAGIGAVVVGGVVTAIALGSGGGAPEPLCPSMASCPLD